MTKKDFNELFNKALEIAFEAHKGQVDKGGQAYIMHPIRVSQKCKSPEAKIVALLHDVIEDCPMTASDLTKKGIPQNLVDEIVLLSHDKEKSYYSYIAGICGSETAKEVKLSDLEDNMNLLRIHGELTEKDFARLQQYKKSYAFLNDEK